MLYCRSSLQTLVSELASRLRLSPTFGPNSHLHSGISYSNNYNLQKNKTTTHYHFLSSKSFFFLFISIPIYWLIYYVCRLVAPWLDPLELCTTASCSLIWLSLCSPSLPLRAAVSALDAPTLSSFFPLFSSTLPGSSSSLAPSGTSFPFSPHFSILL
jgi:hypothetical protein